MSTTGIRRRDLEQVVRQGARSLGRRVAGLTPGGAGGRRPWDREFQAWIDEAEALGRDPNDIGDERWNDPVPAIEEHYRPLFDADDVVMELGPGTGRYTRHLLAHCREMVLVDYSALVCDWVSTHFAGQGRFRVVHATDYELREIADGSIDAIVANGVFEHVYLEGFYRYFETFARVLAPGGRGCFNFNNIMSPGGLDRFVAELPSGIDDRSIFRFYHPDEVAALCEATGLEVDHMKTSDDRFAFLTFRRP